MFKTYHFQGEIPWPHILFLGAVHGNETAGPQAQKEIINLIQKGEITIKKGQVTFIPIVNEAAYQKDVRCIDVNLNRVIKKHESPQNNEEKIANELTDYIENCDIMVDLHSTHCPDDEEFWFIDYPDEKNCELLSLIPVKVALAWWPEIYRNHPEITNFCTEEYAHQNGKAGMTVECGYHKSPHAIQVAKQTIENVLSYYGIIDTFPVQIFTPKMITLDSFITKEKEGKMLKAYQHLDPIQKGEVIARYEDGEEIRSPLQGYLIMPHHEAKLGTEWFYFGR